MSWVPGAAPKPHAGSSNGDVAINCLRGGVTWSVLAGFATQRGMKNWICDGLVVEVVYSVLGTIGSGPAAAPVALSLGNNGRSHL